MFWLYKVFPVPSSMCLSHPCQWQNFMNTITFSFLRLRHLFTGKWAFPAQPIQYGREGDSLVFQVIVVLHPKPPVYTAVTCHVTHTYTSLEYFSFTNSYSDYLSSTFCSCMYMNAKPIKFGESFFFLHFVSVHKILNYVTFLQIEIHKISTYC